LREAYPQVPPERLATIAHRTAAQRSRLGAPPIRAAAHTRMIIETAAVFGFDPIAPERAVDVLILLRTYPDEPTARAAIDTALAGRPKREASMTARLVSRLLPGASLSRRPGRTGTLARDTVHYFERLARRHHV
jgi:hypothetical protein